jgi:lanosterol synthase
LTSPHPGRELVQPSPVSPELTRGIAYLTSVQRPTGAVAGEVVWCPVITAQYILVAYLVGRAIPPGRRGRLLRQLAAWQRPEGGWGLHADSGSYVFVTTLVYVALRLLGTPAEDERCRRARAWLRANGGVGAIPSWGKLWLAMLNLYAYEGVHPVLPELWLLPEFLPIHPRRWYCHTRLIYLGFSYLYGVRLQTATTPVLEALRGELYDAPYSEIDFATLRSALAPTDLYARPSWLLRQLYRLFGAFERRCPPALRRRALRRALSLIVAHGRQSDHVAISPVSGLLNVLALHHAGHPDFAPAFRGLDYWAWSDDAEGERFAGARSDTWDTAFAVQAICEGPAAGRAADFLRGAARYFREAQLREEVPDYARHYRDPQRGGFCFGDARQGWPVSDCTAEAVSALAGLGDRVSMSESPAPEMIADALRFILTRQNPDGGWSSFERRRGPVWLDRLNSAEMFGDCMIERSYIECTGSCLQALRHTLDRFGEILPARDRSAAARAIRRGAAFLRRRQGPDGSWPGFWGVHHTYGTLFAVVGLRAAGVPPTDPALKRAGRWLVATRLPDGGWGESWQGCLRRRPLPAERSQVIMTSWALIALLKAGYEGPGVGEAVEGGVRLLRERQLPDGNWPEEQVAGVFFATAMLHYRLYRSYFPVWALGLFERAIAAGSGAARAVRM